MSTADKLTFYNAEVCPYAHRAWIALTEKKLTYSTETVDLQNKSEDFKEQYAKAHPNPEAAAKVPLLIDDGTYLIESNLIVEYLDDKYPEAGGIRFFPEDPVDRYRVRLFAELFNGQVNIYKLLMADSQQAADAVKADLVKGLQAVDKILRTQGSEEGGSYFLGSRYSFAEVSTTPFVRRLLLLAPVYRDFDVRQQAKELKLDRLDRWLQAVMERESNKTTGPTDEKIIEAGKKWVKPITS